LKKDLNLPYKKVKRIGNKLKKKAKSQEFYRAYGIIIIISTITITTTMVMP
jgi:hypothetical protein